MTRDLSTFVKFVWLLNVSGHQGMVIQFSPGVVLATLNTVPVLVKTLRGLWPKTGRQSGFPGTPHKA